MSCVLYPSSMPNRYSRDLGSHTARCAVSTAERFKKRICKALRRTDLESFRVVNDRVGLVNSALLDEVHDVGHAAAAAALDADAQAELAALALRLQLLQLLQR